MPPKKNQNIEQLLKEIEEKASQQTEESEKSKPDEKAEELLNKVAEQVSDKPIDTPQLQTDAQKVTQFLKEGKMAENRGDYQKALYFFNKAVQISGSPTAYRALGRCYSKDSEPAKAIRAYRKVIEILPHSARDHYKLALVLQEGNIFEEAKKEFREALELKLNHQSESRFLDLLSAAQLNDLILYLTGSPKPLIRCTGNYDDDTLVELTKTRAMIAEGNTEGLKKYIPELFKDASQEKKEWYEKFKDNPKCLQSLTKALENSITQRYEEAFTTGPQKRFDKAKLFSFYRKCISQ